MGQASLRKKISVPTVYHHTSTLRTNLLWMSGFIELEGHGNPAIHPKIGRIEQYASVLRSMKDFPPLVWFTTKITIPQCLLKSRLVGIDNTTGNITDFGLHPDLLNAQALNRIALGFHISDISVTPWKSHAGYETEEGRELNESARDVGDDPDDWYVSEVPVDLIKVSEVWTSASIFKPKLTRADWYLADIKRMVSLCRANPKIFIPPSWLKPDEAKLLGKIMSLKSEALDDTSV